MVSNFVQRHLVEKRDHFNKIPVVYPSIRGLGNLNRVTQLSNENCKQLHIVGWPRVRLRLKVLCLNKK